MPYMISPPSTPAPLSLDASHGHYGTVRTHEHGGCAYEIEVVTPAHVAATGVLQRLGTDHGARIADTTRHIYLVGYANGSRLAATVIGVTLIESVPTIDVATFTLAGSGSRGRMLQAIIESWAAHHRPGALQVMLDSKHIDVAFDEAVWHQLHFIHPQRHQRSLATSMGRSGLLYDSRLPGLSRVSLRVSVHVRSCLALAHLCLSRRQ